MARCVEVERASLTSSAMASCSGRRSMRSYILETVPPCSKARLTSSSGAAASCPSSAASQRASPAERRTREERTSLREKGRPPASRSEARWVKTGLRGQLTSPCMSARRASSPEGRSERASSRMRHSPQSASTSSPARCVTEAHPKAAAMSARRCVVRRGSAMRESESVSIQVSETPAPPGTASMKVRSKVALWASTGDPPTNSASAATASRALGASMTSRLVMPVSRVISSGMGPQGWTKVSKRSTTSRPDIRAAEISMRSQSLKERPVVSVSRTTTSSSSGPKSRPRARPARLR